MCFTGMKPRLSSPDIFLCSNSCVSPAAVFGDIVPIDKITSLALIEEIKVWQVALGAVCCTDSPESHCK